MGWPKNLFSLSIRWYGKNLNNFFGQANINKGPSVQFSCSIVSDSDPMAWSFPVHHQLPELAQTYVQRVGEAIQPSHPLSFPSPLAFHLSQHQGLFQWVSSSHQVAKVLELQLQHQSFWCHSNYCLRKKFFLYEAVTTVSCFIPT